MATRKVRIIAAFDNTGKTRCIREIARRLEAKNYKYNNLLYTKTAASILNKNSEAPLTNDDIIGYFVGSFETIGILSAGDGDGEQEITKCLDLLDEFQPDIIICAARNYPENTDIQKKIGERYQDIDTKTISLNGLNGSEADKEEEFERVFSEIMMAIRGF